MHQTETIFVEQLSTEIFSKSKKIFLLADENTAQFCFPKIKKSSSIKTIIFPAGEKHKNIITLTKIWEELALNFADRNSLIINVGGGVVCDIGGFAAATYMRGISFIHVPTSLLAMADAAHGNKTGIDLLNYKNMIGVFAQPDYVFIYPEFLKTLPKRELLSGWAEIVKHYIIADAAAFHNLWKENTQITSIANWQPILEKAIRIKQTITKRDPLEKNIRKTLNFGHTIGHAIESTFLNSNNNLLHGEAVAIGMLIETLIAEDLKLIQTEEAEKIYDVLTNTFEIRPKILPIAEIIKTMQHDKKNQNDVLQFSLPNRIGNCLFNCEISEDNILKAIEKYNEHYTTK